MKNRANQHASLITSFVLVVGLLVLPTINPAQSNKNKGGSNQSQKTTFSGQATVVKANVAGQPITLSDTGALDSTGGEKEASLLEANVPGVLTAEVLHASTIGNGNHSRSEASVANLNLTVGGNTIIADFLRASAQAVCAGGASAGGSSEIANLVINGQAITVTGEPNQTIDLPLGGQVIINEQTSTRQGDITVNALHVIIPGVADVIIASAHADITCAKATCPGKDFVTGGGWIIAPSGSKGTFGVAGGIMGKGLWGHLTYIDHGANLKVKGIRVTGYTVTAPNSRRIEGTCEINGLPGTYTVEVTDNGEPGKGKDIFTITLSNGYTAGGLLEGGNIQLHTPCK
ncbi:MAG TPA: choice-of-anchor P family protein [Pyrinomonadaceae bacterium]|nr:choice-of-anchor P family protein [Pyrinomonadaceae bacterium]